MPVAMHRRSCALLAIEANVLAHPHAACKPIEIHSNGRLADSRIRAMADTLTLNDSDTIKGVNAKRNASVFCCTWLDC